MNKYYIMTEDLINLEKTLFMLLIDEHIHTTIHSSGTFVCRCTGVGKSVYAVFTVGLQRRRAANGRNNNKIVYMSNCT